MRRSVYAGAILVAVTGLPMLNYGWNMKPSSSNSAENVTLASVNANNEKVQIIESSLTGGRYPAITVKRGIPVIWIIKAPHGSINGCNNRLIIPEYGIEHSLKPSENVIEFSPAVRVNSPIPAGWA